MVQNGDINGLAVNINQLIENNSLRELMGRTARVNVNRFLADAVMKRWDELFKELVV